MHVSPVCRSLLVALFVLIAWPAETALAQATNTSGKGSLTKPADPSYSIDPTSVENFSDEQLVETFTQMTSQYSKNAVLFNNIGASFFQRKMYDKAEAALRRAAMLTNHPAFLTNLSILFETQERVPEAIAAAQRAVAQAPKYARGRSQLCELYVTSKRNNEALACYEEFSKVGPLAADGETFYALALLRTGNADRAISMVTPLVKGPTPTPLMYNVLGYALYQKKRYNQAVEAFKQGVELDPDSPNLRYNLAMAMSANNNRIGALSQYSFVKEKNSAIADQLYRNLYRDKIIFVNEPTATKTP